MVEGERSSDLVVARRPVIDLTRALVAFELVYRPLVPEVERYASADSVPVALHELLRSHAMKLDDVVGEHQVLVEVALDVMAGDAPLMLPPHRTVLQLAAAPEGTTDEEIAQACTRRRDEGYRVLLGVDEATTSLPEGVREVVDLVAVEVAGRDAETVRTQVRGLRAQELTVLLRGCDTLEEVRTGLRTGATWLQGVAVGSPPPRPGARIAPSALAQVRLGMELLSRDLDVRRIESILRSEPTLLAQVLDLAAAGRSRGIRGQIRNVREALVVMGNRRVQRWAAVTILGRHGSPDVDALLAGLVRARTCELLAPAWGVDADLAFTAGLLSALGLLLGVEPTTILERLDLDDDLVTAAFRREGPLGEGIDRVEAHQRVLDGATSDDDFADVAPAATAAFGWATALLAAVSESAPAD